MGSVIKGNRYRLIDNRSFELPLPIKYELLKEDNPVALYEVSADEKVSVSILTKYKENMITPINRSLDMSDIYYFFSSRVFQNNTPFTAMELQLLGLEKYSVYDIIRKTRGVTPYDTYWLRFEGDSCDYETALEAWMELTTHIHSNDAEAPAEQPVSEPPKPAEPPKSEQPVSEPPKPAEPPKAEPPVSDDITFNTPPGTVKFVATSDKTLDEGEESQVNDILDQHKVNFGELAAEKGAETLNGAAKPAENKTMTMDEIDALLLGSGLGDAAGISAPAPVEEPKPSGGKMSQEDIEKMLAAASAPEPAPVEEPKPSGGKMSQDDIEKMLAAASAPELVPAPVEEPKPSGGKMSQEDIEKMLAAASAPEPAHVEEPKPSGGKMSQEDIEKMLAAASAPEPAPVEEPKPSGGKMSQEDIEKMLAAASAPEPAPAPVEEPKPSGGKMSQEDIEKMLAAASAPEPAPAPVEEPKPSGGKMSQEDIEKMLAAASAPEPAPVEEPKPSGGKMSQEDIEKMLAAASAPEPAPAPVEEPKPSGGKMSQEDIEALLNGMKEDAGQ